MISVCMCTYNGEKYIVKQLQSILEQTRQPDEVVICDDCSTDRTCRLIKEFIVVNGLALKWILHENTSNKGYPDNFYYAMSLCKGDIVFLADQDDLWNRDKLEKMSALMSAHKEIELLASNWGGIDSVDRGARMVSHARRTKRKTLVKIAFEEIFYCYNWPGMSMCYRKDLGLQVLKCVGNCKLAHDVALALVAAEQDSFYNYNEVLQYHRQHDANTAMEEHRIYKLLNKPRKLAEVENYLIMLSGILESGCVRNLDKREFILDKKKIMEERKENLLRGSRWKIWRQYCRCYRYIRLKTVVCDMIICRQK